MAQVERALRLWRLAALFAAALSVCAVALALRALFPGEVRAHEFALVGGEGGVQARLGLNERGEPRLLFRLRKNGGTVTVGALAEDIGGVAVTGKDATIMIATDSTGSPSVSVQSDKKTASLGIGREGEPTLLMTAPAPNLKFIPNLSATPAGVRVRLPDGEVVHFPTRPAGGPQGVEKPPDQSKN
jgi:hypothetical protein